MMVMAGSALVVSAHGGDDSESWIRTFFGGFDIMILSNSMHIIGSMLLLSGILIMFVSLKQLSASVSESALNLDFEENVEVSDEADLMDIVESTADQINNSH